MKQERIEVGTVYLRMAKRARLVLGGLVMERGNPWCSSVHVGRVATQTKEVDIIDKQHARIRGSMR